VTSRTNLNDEHVAAVTLAGLDGLGSGRLRALVERFGTPTRAVSAIVRGRASDPPAGRSPDRREQDPRRRWGRWASEIDVEAVRALLAARHAQVWLDQEPGYPITDVLPERPALLVAEGARVDALEQPRVAIVGTRSATPHGLADAHELAATLADAGVTIVSGLAIGSTARRISAQSTAVV
jgi:DNA processing protein